MFPSFYHVQEVSHNMITIFLKCIPCVKAQVSNADWLENISSPMFIEPFQMNLVP
jgi:hypothetical protein